MLDGTALVDIKPYVWTWDAYPGIRSGCEAAPVRLSPR